MGHPCRSDTVVGSRAGGAQGLLGVEAAAELPRAKTFVAGEEAREVELIDEAQLVGDGLDRGVLRDEQVFGPAQALAQLIVAGGPPSNAARCCAGRSIPAASDGEEGAGRR
jgi:hypothetical protein